MRVLPVQEKRVDFCDQCLPGHAGHTLGAAVGIDISDNRTKQGPITAVPVGIVMLVPATALTDQRAPDSG